MDSLKGFILAQLNIRGIKFREYFGLKFANFFENGKFAKINSAKNQFYYLSPKNISEMVQKASKSQKMTLLIFQNFEIRENQFRKIFRKLQTREK